MVLFICYIQGSFFVACFPHYFNLNHFPGFNYCRRRNLLFIFMLCSWNDICCNFNFVLLFHYSHTPCAIQYLLPNLLLQAADVQETVRLFFLSTFMVNNSISYKENPGKKFPSIQFSALKYGTTVYEQEVLLPTSWSSWLIIITYKRRIISCIIIFIMTSQYHQ